ncbi:hypothetical protein [Acidocella sp.]|uniref:hypothetical protein n=1 Tax=Acidocella sp. TaxID=50710 RepID=UPI002F3E61E4
MEKFNDLPKKYWANIDNTDPSLDRHLGDKPALTDAEVSDLVAFLKTLSAAEAWTGLAAVPMIVLAAGLLGLAMALPLALRRGQGGQTMIPFGPALALACFGMVLLGG